MLKFYYSGAPNPTKVALFLEEAGIQYEALPVDTRRGEQHKPKFVAINPNAKLPAIVDGDVTVFDSNAILLYLGILDARLAKQRYMLGDTYTIVDMDVWGWARLIPTVLGETAWAKFPNLKRLVDEISARPAAQRAVALKDRHKFKTEMDDESRKALFRHLTEKVA
jgi:glutathione S-transferase